MTGNRILFALFTEKMFKGAHVIADRAMERADSQQSFASSVASRRESGEVVRQRGDEVAIVVSNRKDSLTNAVR